MQKEKKVIKFYTTIEKKELASFISGKVSANDENLAEFCKTHQRPVGGVRAYIYSCRKNTKNEKAMVKAERKNRKNVETATITKDEFVIPIKKWEIRTDGANNTLVLHFQK